MITTSLQTRTLSMGILQAGSGPLVLLCHGFPETAFAWRHQIAALSRAGYRVVAPDLRGYGHTDAPANPAHYSVPHAVEDMLALLDALGEDTCAIVGHDWGATIAWQAALLHPQRFRAVAALTVPMMGPLPVAPSRLFPQTGQDVFYALYLQTPEAAAELERDPATTLRRILFAASGEAGPRQPGADTPNPFGMVSRHSGLLAALPDPDRLPDWMPAAEFDRLVETFTLTGFRGGLNYYRNLDTNWQHQQQTAGATVPCPALFLIGERDPGWSIPGMPQIIAAQSSLVPGLRGSHVLPGAGHWLQQERSDAVSAHLISFLSAAQTNPANREQKRNIS